MSHFASSYVIRRRFGNPTRKLIMMLLADHANASHEAWPAIDTLAARAECSRRSVQIHLQALATQGEIQIRTNAGRNGSNVYRILFRKFAPGEIDETGVQNLHGGVQITGAILHGGGADHGRYSAPESVRNHQEPSGRGEEENPPPPGLDSGILKNLARCFPHAPAAIVGRERIAFGEVASLLAELTPDDWTAIHAWNFCPKRIRGRTLWPRDRAEFLANASEAVEAIRKWWTRGGRTEWHTHTQKRVSAPSSPPPAPTGEILTRQEIAQFLKP